MFQGRGSDVLHSYGANVGIFLGKNDQVVIDSGFHNSTAEHIMRFLRQRKHRAQNKFIVNTHYHSDHVFGNGLLARNGAVVIAQHKARREMRRQSQKMLDHYRNQNPKLRQLLKEVHVHLPNATFEDALSLYPDDVSKIELLHPGYRAHTDGDTIVHVTKDHVVFAGDILWVDYHTNLEDADLQGLIRASKMILRLRPRRIIPGHGPVSGVRELLRSIKYLEQLHRNSSRAIRKGLRGRELYRASIPSWSWDWRMRWMVESYLDHESERK
jgi:glyoxylase-like metal-dependent hydrolase (beta-lactamase superfamily II)